MSTPQLAVRVPGDVPVLVACSNAMRRQQLANPLLAHPHLSYVGLALALMISAGTDFKDLARH